MLAKRPFRQPRSQQLCDCWGGVCHFLAVMETKVKERPILFSGPMVRALLDGKKTQTRRALKEQPTTGCWLGLIADGPGSVIGKHLFLTEDSELGILDKFVACPYGKPGDRLWVRETSRLLEKAYTQKNDTIIYRATASEAQVMDVNMWGGWTSSIFMPRAASRLLLEIVAVRSERLQEMSEADAKAEGCQIGLAPRVKPEHTPCVNCGRIKRDHDGVSYCCKGLAGVFCPNTYKGGYAALWESINGPDSWAANPWVWVVTFKVVEPVTPTIQEGAQS
jgi:hypothetical protein